MILKTQFLVHKPVSEDLKGLGIESEAWEDINIILNKVCAFGACKDEYEQFIANETEIYIGEAIFTINVPYIEFERMMQEVVKNG